MRKMMQRSLSCLLTLAMVVTMLMTSTLAAEKSAKLEFDYSANYDSSKVVSLEVYKGYPADSYAKEEEIFSQLEAITPQADGSYVVTAPGTYAYHVHGTGYYNILQLFNVTEADLTDGSIGILTLMVKAGLAASNGEARRLVVQGGVLADGEKVAVPTASFTAEQLAKGIVIKKGKKIYHKVTL